MNYRLFSKLFYIIICGFILLNAFIWFTWTKDITSPTRKTGDLVRIGYIKGFTSQHLQAKNLSKHHIEANNFKNQPIDMITVGDSFSIGNSLNVGSYQDNIASLFNISILNIPTQKDLSFHPVTMLSRLINSGYLDKVKPKYVLLQTIEREALNRLVYGFNLNNSATITELENEFSNRGKAVNPLDLDRNLRFINNGNWKFVANNVQYRFCDHPLKSKVFMSKLNQRFFSSEKGDILLFHRDDIKAVHKNSVKVMENANNNLNQLANILKSKGITLIFMPIPDKLTLYRPYLNNKNYPKSIFFEELRKLSKQYIFIDTEKTLSKELASGVQDLYYQDDTHWSCKAPEAIAKDFKLQ